MVNILLVGVATGLDLENAGRDPWCAMFVGVVGVLTLVVFSAECVLKIVSEGTQPWHYFTDSENGSVNAFDFVIVVASLALVDSDNGGTVSALRMLRLVRLLTFVKGAPVLRVIVVGLIQGIKSVVYIVVLLLLVVYIFAILGTMLFGINDPVHFGNVAISMLTLFQVSCASVGVEMGRWGESSDPMLPLFFPFFRFSGVDAD
jgi:voltage-gated sodium channel